ncbi:MAG: hypothetical protein IPG81_11670 [Sandaracinaceae bacterium]|nr:hypothetical protein [Sandaracinaceae bacterium]MBK7155282.1 hypothetical protein [Sandaracinaceae bacterium]MBK8589199.1 hypothetical protein [Sandaracinaceae bacterium]MBP7683685.1 hypothetical protein [Deltaproteobacteria bacterium]
MEPVENVKHRARLLHKRATEADPVALAALRQLPELRALGDAELSATLQRKHCLTALAKALGFATWPHTKAVLSGEALATLATKPDLGTLMHRDLGGAYWNIWSASYDEASTIRAEHGGFLLPYRKQFLIVEDHYIEALGLDPRDPDWSAIGRNWPAPGDRDAWSRLTTRAVDARLDG